MQIDPKVLDAMVEAGAEACRAEDRFDAVGCEPWAQLSEGSKSMWRKLFSAGLTAALRAAEALDVPHKLVGREVTQRMIDAGRPEVDFHYLADDEIERRNMRDAWSAMFDAAPGVEE